MQNHFISVTTIYPAALIEQPPIIFVHGSANSAKVWNFWQKEIADLGWTSHAIDLRAHGNSNKIDLSSTSMEDYAEDIKLLIRTIPRAPVLIGWSMGGLLAMMVASKGHAVACVSLAPSMPAQERDSSVLIRMGEFGPEEYGITSGDPNSQTGMADLDTEERIIALSSVGLESRMARDERKAGIRIDKMTCPLMIMTGTDDEAWPFQTYQGLWIPFTHQSIQGASHWGLVLNRRALKAAVNFTVQWLKKVCSV